MTIGDRIKARRLELNMSVEELAAKLNKNRATIYRYESNDIENFPITILEPLAKVLCTTPAYLMGWNRPIDEFDKKVLELYPDFVPGKNHLPTTPSSSLDLPTYKPNNFKSKHPSNSYPAETEFINIPVLGSVSAGLGCLADNEIIGYEPWSASSIKYGHEYIVLKVSGDSMYPSLIEGDLVLIQCQSTVDSGKIAVLTVNGDEGVIKKVVYGSDWIELHSVNPMYPIRRFDGEDILLVNVMGLVVESKRKF